MVNRPMLWAAENPRIQRTIHDSKLFRGIVHRFIAGDEHASISEINVHAFQQRYAEAMGL